MAFHGPVPVHTLARCAQVRPPWRSLASPALATCRVESVVVLHVVLAVLREIQVVYSGTGHHRLRAFTVSRELTKDVADVRGSLHLNARPPSSFFPTLGTCALRRSQTAQSPPASTVKWSG